MRVLHLTTVAALAAARRDGDYRISSHGLHLDDAGFIHACTRRQLPGVAARFYGQVTEPLVALVVDLPACRSAGSDVRWEPAADAAGELFPHVYGPIPLAAIVAELPATVSDGQVRIDGEEALEGLGVLTDPPADRSTGRSERTIATLTRHPERGSTQRADLDALLDSQWFGTLSTVTPDGSPWAVPMLYARDGDRLLLHGSTGAGALRAVSAGAPAVLTVMSAQALVVGHTTFESSLNYRSATVRGIMRRATGAEQAQALDRFSEVLLPGRTGEVRPMTRKELAATTASVLDIVEGQWLYKAREGWPCDAAESGSLDHPSWAGIVPVHTVYGKPVPAPWVTQEVPDSVRRLAAGGPAHGQ